MINAILCLVAVLGVAAFGLAKLGIKEVAERG
ncbi:hypothetical protein SAMN05444680_112183 [Variovorax sp. YR216]|nr:hypothetical protein SAMN05444680_112183 [Variovorax sp. YR216]